MVNRMNRMNSTQGSLIAHPNRAPRNSIWLACALTLLAPAMAQAAQWNVDPVRVELSEQQQTAAIIVRNESDQPSSIQIQAVVWSQLDGLDVYTPTRDLLVSPPIATIPPNSDQVVRVALRRGADATRELAYRINLQELPVQAEPGFAGVQVALRIGLPVFVQPQRGDAAAKMVWSVARAGGDQLRVALRNDGNAHVQISDFSLYAPGNAQAITGESGSSYVLAGQAHEWLLKTGAVQAGDARRVRLKAYTDAVNVDTELVLGR